MEVFETELKWRGFGFKMWTFMGVISAVLRILFQSKAEIGKRII